MSNSASKQVKNWEDIVENAGYVGGDEAQL